VVHYNLCLDNVMFPSFIIQAQDHDCNIIKDRLCFVYLLSLSNSINEIEFDSFEISIGANLMQEGQSTAYFNERLNGATLNYPTNDKELYTNKLDLSGKYDIGITFNVTDFSPFDTGGDSRTNPFEEGGNDMNLASLEQTAPTTSI